MSDEYDPFEPEVREQRDDDRHVAEILTEDRENGDIAWLMSGVKGRRIVCRMLDQADVMSSSFAPNAMQMAFNEGQKASGIKLLAKVTGLCPKAYHKMRQENQHDRAAASNRSTSNN